MFFKSAVMRLTAGILAVSALTAPAFAVGGVINTGSSNLNMRAEADASSAVVTKIPGGSTVVLYLGQTAPEETKVVPNVVGMSYEKARAAMEEAGFFMRASGVSVYYGESTLAEVQSVVPGTELVAGTVINVQFTNVVEDGWVDAGLG
jgi:hypothetical protein